MVPAAYPTANFLPQGETGKDSIIVCFAETEACSPVFTSNAPILFFPVVTAIYLPSGKYAIEAISKGSLLTSIRWPTGILLEYPHLNQMRMQ